MIEDIRVSTSFFNHPKTILLRRRLGPDAVLALQQLWCYCAVYKQKGDLTGMSDDSIEVAAGWTGEHGALIQHLTAEDSRFIDRTAEKTVIHDWEDHNPWAFGAPERSVNAKISALLKHGKTEEAERMRTACAPHAKRIRNGCGAHAPSPSPSPLPYPSTALGAEPVFPPGFEPDRITSDTPLPPLAQAAWDKLCETYPHPKGLLKGRDKAIRLFVRAPAEWNRFIKNAGHYSCSDSAQSGFVMGLDKFLDGAYRDYDDAEQPLGHSPPRHDDAWKQELAQDERDAAQDRMLGKGPKKPPWKTTQATTT